MKDELDFVAKINDGKKIYSIDNQESMKMKKNKREEKKLVNE